MEKLLQIWQAKLNKLHVFQCKNGIPYELTIGEIICLKEPGGKMRVHVALFCIRSIVYTMYGSMCY